jgi:hypothetical protein
MSQITALLLAIFFSSFSMATVENCIANGQFANDRDSAARLCASQTALSQKDCVAKVKCFAPISYCVTGATSGESLESVVSQCARTKSATDCEASLKCFSNVSSCTANGQSGTSASEAVDYCVFRTKMNRAQCLQSLQCEEEKYPMPPRPTLPPPATKTGKSG